MVTQADLLALREQKPEIIKLLADLASIEADGTAALWRRIYTDLPARDRQRLVDEVAAGDPVACLLALTLDVRVAAATESAGGAA